MNPNFHGPLYSSGGTRARALQFFAPGAFQAPAYGTVGNAGRDTLTGPNSYEWDLSALKTFPVTERMRVQFRSEFFNVLNHTNLQTPNEVVLSSGPTQGTAANRQAPAVASPTAGVVTAAAPSRQVQFGVKVLF